MIAEKTDIYDKMQRDFMAIAPTIYDKIISAIAEMATVYREMYYGTSKGAFDAYRPWAEKLDSYFQLAKPKRIEAELRTVLAM